MFQEAEITGIDKRQDEILQVTTDDLVLWLGEKLVETKHQVRILNLQKKKIMEIEGQLLKFQSQKVSADQVANEVRIQNEKTISDSQIRIKDLEAQLLKLQTTKQEYAVSLENKVHEVALERDEFKKEIEELKQENEGLVDIIQKRKKK